MACATRSLVPTPSVDDTRIGFGIPSNDARNSPPKEPMSDTTSGVNVPRAMCRTSRSASSCASMSTPESRYDVPSGTAGESSTRLRFHFRGIDIIPYGRVRFAENTEVMIMFVRLSLVVIAAIVILAFAPAAHAQLDEQTAPSDPCFDVSSPFDACYTSGGNYYYCSANGAWDQ